MLENTYRSAISLLLAAFASAGCGLYECATESRSATYVGRLGQSIAPANVAGDPDDGSVSLLLNEWRGSITQQNVIARVNIVGFVPGVSELHVHAGSPASPGRLLWRSSAGILVRDSVWQDFGEIFAGPATWGDLWSALDEGRAFIEVHSASGASASAGVRQEHIETFSRSCT